MPRYYYPKTSKGTTDQYRQLTTQFLKDNGYFSHDSVKTGVITWYSNGTQVGRIGIKTEMCLEQPSVNFDYRIKDDGATDWETENYSYDLVKAPCNYGGYRWYFECGAFKDGEYCGRRVAILYLRENIFCCRHCAELTYKSCNESNYYRGGYFKYLSDLGKAENHLLEKVKRTHYAGKPTRNYRKYLEIMFPYENTNTLSEILHSMD